MICFVNKNTIVIKIVLNMFDDSEFSYSILTDVK